MKFHVGTVILLAIVAIVVARQNGKSKVNLKQVVQNCYKKNQATCKEINSFLKGLKNNVVGKNNDVLCYLACLNVDSGSMVPKKPFNVNNLNRWYNKKDWAQVDSLATKCSSGANMKIANVCNRMYDVIKCTHADKSLKIPATTTSSVPAACQ